MTEADKYLAFLACLVAFVPHISKTFPLAFGDETTVADSSAQAQLGSSAEESQWKKLLKFWNAAKNELLISWWRWVQAASGSPRHRKREKYLQAFRVRTLPRGSNGTKQRCCRLDLCLEPSEQVNISPVPANGLYCLVWLASNAYFYSNGMPSCKCKTWLLEKFDSIKIKPELPAPCTFHISGSRAGVGFDWGPLTGEGRLGRLYIRTIPQGRAFGLRRTATREGSLPQPRLKLRMVTNIHWSHVLERWGEICQAHIIALF